MKAAILKLSFDSKESTQKIQIRIYKDQDVDDSGADELLNVFKGQKMLINLEEQQTHLDMETGEIKNAKAEIVPESLGISITILENTQVWTLTATFSDLDTAQRIVTSKMIGCMANVIFR